MDIKNKQSLIINYKSHSLHPLLRSHCVSVRLNAKELQLLNINRGSYRKGEWLRMSFLQNLPPVIPTINTEAWKKLSDISQKLNRIATHIDCKSKESQQHKISSNTSLFHDRRSSTRHTPVIVQKRVENR
jgi:hypothetical protein